MCMCLCLCLCWFCYCFVFFLSWQSDQNLKQRFLPFLPAVLQLVVQKPAQEIRSTPKRGRENPPEPKPGHCARLYSHSENDKTRRGKTDNDDQLFFKLILFHSLFRVNQPRWRSMTQKSQQRRCATFCLGPNRFTCATRSFTTTSCCSTAAWSSPTSTTTTTTAGPTATSTPAASAPCSPTPCSRWMCAPRSSRCPSVKDRSETPAAKLGPGVITSKKFPARSLPGWGAAGCESLRWQ